MREFDYLIVNDDLERAVQEFESIIRAERARAGLVTDAELESYLRS